MKDKRKDLIAQLEFLRKKESKIRKQIEAIDYSERFLKAKKYVGKCYSLSDEHIHSVFIYAIDKKTCELQSLVIHDFGNGDGTHFAIEQSNLHNPQEKRSFSYKYKEISKKKFYEQFDIIHNQIKKIYETKKLPTNHYANDGKNSI
jgi:hypothetical protein